MAYGKIFRPQWRSRISTEPRESNQNTIKFWFVLTVIIIKTHYKQFRIFTQVE